MLYKFKHQSENFQHQLLQITMEHKLKNAKEKMTKMMMMKPNFILIGNGILKN